MAEQGRSGAFAVACGVLVAVGLLVATGFAASRTSTATVATPRTDPTPVTTMAPVRPVAEYVAPQESSTGVAASWVESMSARTGIGPVALEAYGAASLRLATEEPGCKVGWTTLAGIGGIESGHGTNGGSHLLEDGSTSQYILGPALDGTAGMAAIRSDEESVQWHGDLRWDHAVGPMQFIPSTWRTWESDGNDDGVADPNNVFDAAYAAGRYLCASGADLTTGSGWTRAIFSYNHSDDYVRSVLARANRYAAAR